MSAPNSLAIRISGTIIDELNGFDAFMNVNDNGRSAVVPMRTR